jgi:hypothetical protein
MTHELGCSDVKASRFKLVAGVVGASAVVAMAVLTLTVSGGSSGGGMLVSEPPDITTGETVTSSTAPLEPETSVATPPFTFTTPSGFAVPH